MWIFVSIAVAGPVNDRITADHQLIWAGMDNRALEMFVPETFADPEETVHWDPGGGLFDFTGRFATPKDAWARLCGDWNLMLQHDTLKRMERDLKAPVRVDVPDTCKQAKRDPWFYPDYEASRHPADLDAEAVGKQVKTLKLKATSGLAMVVVGERFSREEGQACVWPTFFDVASKEVVFTRRECGTPTGISFRNYWYNPVLSAVKGVIREIRDAAI